MSNLYDDPNDKIWCDKDGIGGKLPDELLEKATKNIAALIKNFEYAETLKALTNGEIADLLLNFVWAELNITGKESAIVQEAIDRLNSEN